jgi:hypothetical protein
VAGAAAAAAKRRKQLREQEEEEAMRYTPEELEEDWEFKIVRSETSAFRKPETLKQLIEEESRAGWALLEKLDDGRVRFKRSPSARHRDALLPQGVDPYRTRYGPSSARYAVKVGVLMVALLLFGVLAFLLVAQRPERIQWSSISVLIGIVFLAVGMLLVLLRRRR